MPGKTSKSRSTDRRKLRPGKKAARRPNGEIVWTQKIHDLLGKVPDREISERYGIDISTLCKRRKRYGIPRFERVRRTARVVKILALPTKEAARRLGLSHSMVVNLRKKWELPGPSRTEWRWTPKTLARLGKEPDTWIAWTTGMGFRTVRAKREALGIPSCGRLRKWTPEEDALLGTAPDDEIAERIGRTRTAVAAHRMKLKIPMWSKR
jgi:hypothetical protein